MHSQCVQYLPLQAILLDFVLTLIYNAYMQKLHTTSKLILTDADGVLLRWEQPFRAFMEQRGYVFNQNGIHSYNLKDHYLDISGPELNQLIVEFNNSEAMRSLPPLRDAVTYVNKLHMEHNFKFRVITSYGLCQHAIARREHNLRMLFGNAIESLVSIDMGAPKDHVLAEYTGSGLVWIEDKYENFQTGLTVGLKSVLIDHSHNKSKPIDNGHRVTCWKDIYHMLT